MELILVGALALVLGLVLGAILGARRAFAITLSGRAVRGATSRLAPYMPSELPVRTSADILAGRIRVLLGAVTYELPVLPRGPSRRWLESLDARFAALALDLDAAAADTPTIMARLVAETEALYGLLLSYDQSGVLPSAEDLNEVATDAQVLHAVLEVWRAVHPLADTLTAAAAAPTGGMTLEQPSS